MVTLETTTIDLPEAEKIEFGDIKPKFVSSAHVSRFVIASYNIRYAVGRYLISGGLLRRIGITLNAQRSEKVGQNIRAAAQAFTAGKLLPNVDVLALQEADKETVRAGGHHIARELAEQLKMSWIQLPSGLPRGIEPQKRQWWLNFEEQIQLFDPGDTGVALLSHFPLEDVVRIDLPWSECPWRPRLSVGATIQVGAEKVRVFNSHIDPHPSVSGQLEQVQVVMQHARESDGPTILLGDFNTLSNQKCLQIRKLLESEGYATPIPTGTATWRGAGLRMHADWIFVRGLTITKWGVARPLNVSDHWPIWAEIELGG